MSAIFTQDFAAFLGLVAIIFLYLTRGMGSGRVFTVIFGTLFFGFSLYYGGVGGYWADSLAR